MSKSESISASHRSEIVGESRLPGAVISKVARRYGISPNTLYGWRSAAKKSSSSIIEPTSNFVELDVTAATNPQPAPLPLSKASNISKISVEFEHCELSLSGRITVSSLSQILAILEAEC